MLKYGMPDLRAFFAADLRWLKHTALRRADARRRPRSAAMKFTLSWLKDHLDTKASVAEIADTLTRIGLEVEEVFDPATALRPSRWRRC